MLWWLPYRGCPRRACCPGRLRGTRTPPPGSSPAAPGAADRTSLESEIQALLGRSLPPFQGSGEGAPASSGSGHGTRHARLCPSSGDRPFGRLRSVSCKVTGPRSQGPPKVRVTSPQAASANTLSPRRRQEGARYQRGQMCFGGHHPAPIPATACPGMAPRLPPPPHPPDTGRGPGRTSTKPRRGQRRGDGPGVERHL